MIGRASHLSCHLLADRVHGTDNLWVHDASVFPTTSSSHTMLPVMSYAWLAARDMG